MKTPLFMRPRTKDEQEQIQASLRSSSAFVLRRCQILLASARGEHATAIARSLGCDDQTVRNGIKGFNEVGLAVLIPFRNLTSNIEIRKARLCRFARHSFHQR